MRKKKAIYILSCCMIFFFAVYASQNDMVNEKESKYRVALRWNKGYGGETQQQVETALKWVFSFLGAELPKGSFAAGTKWNDNILTVDANKLGFSGNALTAFEKLFIHIKSSGEYIEKGGIDIGRFVMLVLNSPNHYYAITGADKTITDIRSRVQHHDTKAAIIESSIARAHRTIDMYMDTNGSHTHFLAYEGTGSLHDGSFEPEEYETIDIMSNGQLRFAIYDKTGRLKTTSDSSMTFAGKTAKCLWCHEINLQPPYMAKTVVKGHHHPDTFRAFIDKARALLTSYRENLSGDIDFKQKQEHTFAELLYISFSEPSAERLALEWNMSPDSVKNKLKGFPTHTHHEFPFLGTLYDRKDVDEHSPYSYLRVPESAREYSAYEPDLID